MRPVREITTENFRTEPLFLNGDFPNYLTTKRDFIKPEPEGTILLIPFRVKHYTQDCDGSALASLEHIDKEGNTTGWNPHNLGLYPDTALVCSHKELKSMFNEEEHK